MHVLRGFQRSRFLANPCDVLHYAILYHNEEANQGNLPRIVVCDVRMYSTVPSGISCIAHTSVTRRTATADVQVLHTCSFEQFFSRTCRSCELKTKGQ